MHKITDKRLQSTCMKHLENKDNSQIEFIITMMR